MIVIFIFVILCETTVEQKVIPDCPDSQVLHVDPGTKLAFCCYPVKLPRGQEYVRCPINGTHDSTKMCAEGLFQEDETTTESEATCTAELQCITKENRKILECDEKGENCKYACVCNYQEEFCGTAYYDCGPFPKDCPKEYVQEDCSCNKSFPYGSNTLTTKTPSSDVTSQKNSTVTFIPTTGQPKINADNDTVLTVFKNNSTSRPGLEQEKSGIPVLTVVGIVIGIIAIAIAILAFVVVRYRVPLSNKLLCIFKKCRRRGQTNGYVAVSPDVVVEMPMQPIGYVAVSPDVVVEMPMQPIGYVAVSPDVVVVMPMQPIVAPPGKPTAEVKPLVHGLSQEDSGVQSFNMFVESEDAQDSQDVLAQRIPDLPIDGVNEATVVPLEESTDYHPLIVSGQSMEGWVTLSTIPSNSFDSDNTSPKQIESDYDNTAVKQVEDVTDQTERVEVEENQLQRIAVNHQRGASGLPSVVPRFQSGSSGWSSFSDNIYNSTSGQIVDHPPGDFDIQEQEVRIEVNEDSSQVKEEI